MKNVIKVIILLIIVLGLGAYLAIMSFNNPLNSEDTTYKTITIEQGLSTTGIAETLKEEGIINSVKNFKILSKLNGYDGEYQAGTYSLSPSMTPTEIGSVIVTGRVETYAFTIPEGLTIYQVADKLSEEGLINRDTFVTLLEEGDFQFDFLETAQDNENRLEGFLFPDTYKIAYGASEEQIITTMLNQFDLIFTDEYKARADELGMTINEVITVASIVERECKHEEDRPRVASVIYNRLKKGMPLQMCSTVQYILGEQKTRLSTADTQIESPYNTYVNNGLPPGPIGSPGFSAIVAALYPANTDYLYFVVSEKLDGTHNFSSEYNDFLMHKARYNEALEEYENEHNE